MTPAEHRAEAERLTTEAARLRKDLAFNQHAMCSADALVHATLALAPPPPPEKPQPKWALDKPQQFPDGTGGRATVVPARGTNGVIVSIEDDGGLLFEDPSTLRDLASLLTAHADRLEPKP